MPCFCLTEQPDTHLIADARSLFNPPYFFCPAADFSNVVFRLVCIAWQGLFTRISLRRGDMASSEPVRRLSGDQRIRGSERRTNADRPIRESPPSRDTVFDARLFHDVRRKRRMWRRRRWWWMWPSPPEALTLVRRRTRDSRFQSWNWNLGGLAG